VQYIIVAVDIHTLITPLLPEGEGGKITPSNDNSDRQMITPIGNELQFLQPMLLTCWQQLRMIDQPTSN
jgi:hypothetical protein